ncbi:hypothetical protein T440DRAFT_497770 [Plenodomus tracheiphilus IPT5]|uniref:Uncharacterized protein n=1 Tax=Plenodomus tracheiphilus IPT5 TaxID=1408161 RepID=A0A6A7B9N3_9PLEO|nr:hypothetical protein T440DRAFT_497770 [Plenodomus tracheiphilus IPT5]
MATPSPPNWLLGLLSLLSLISFLPQFHHIFRKRSSSGVSTYYLLFNLISTTEQFTLFFFLLVNRVEPFITCLHLPSSYRDINKTLAITIYVAYLCISMVPVLIDLVDASDSPYRKWVGAIFSGIHALFLSYIITALEISTLLAQARMMSRQPQEHGLSRAGLAVQAVVFALVAVTWITRVAFPYDEVEGKWGVGMLLMWFEMVGWAAVDNGVFAVVQMVLLGIAMRSLRGDGGVESGETEPLLRTEGGVIHTQAP